MADAVTQLRYGWAGSHSASILMGAFIIITSLNLRLLSKKRESRLFIFKLFTALTTVVTVIYYVISIYTMSKFYDGSQNTDALLSTTANLEIAINCLFIINTFLADGLLLYRCFVIWKGSRIVIAFPALVFIASTAFSIAFVIVSSSAGAGLSAIIVQRLVLAYFSLSMGLNILVALMISVKLLHFKCTMRAILGEHHVKHYTTITAMVVESAALYAAVSLCTLIVYSTGNALIVVFIPIQGMIQVICPALIIYRVASGKAFEKSYEIKTPMLFSSNPNMKSANISSFPTTSCEPSTTLRNASETQLPELKNRFLNEV